MAHKFTSPISGPGFELVPSPYYTDQALLKSTDERGYQLAEAVGCERTPPQCKEQQVRLTPIRASKWIELYAAGFSGIRVGDRWGFRRGEGPVFDRLSQALKCARSL